MKNSLASLLTIRRAMGAMLAISAVFAVVLSTISLPGDNASAQVADADAEVSKRAAAWFNSLTLDEAINALLGKEADADTPGFGTITTAWDAKSATQSFYDGLPATGNNPLQASVKDLVDGDTTDAGDVYAVGDQISSNAQGIRKLQSVKLWWNHLICAEARTVVGEDRDNLDNNFDDDNDSSTPTVLESSSVCQFPAGTTVDDNPTANAISYDSLSATAKTQVNEVGNALLGLTNGGTYNASDNAMAKRWWSKLSADQRGLALYGSSTGTSSTNQNANDDNVSVSLDRIALARLEYDQIATGTKFASVGQTVSTADAALPLDAASKALVPEVKALINDRAMLVYGNGGTGGKYEGVDVWWDSIGCLEKQIAIGADNEQTTTPTTGNCATFDTLSADSSSATSIRERATTIGRALLGLADIPDAAAWWDKLTDAQRVNVVYGSPLEMESDPAAPKASEADRKAFQQMYADLGTVRVVASDLPAVTTGVLTRHSTPIAPFDHDNDTNTSPEDGYLVKDVVDAIATEIFDPPNRLPGAFRDTGPMGEIVDKDGQVISPNVSGNQPTDDDAFDPPYQSVGDWWETLDCRLMRLAVGEDNDYLAVDTDIDTTGFQNETSAGGYCAHFVGSGSPPRGEGAPGTLTATAQARVETVGKALLARSEVGRPSFNDPATGVPTIIGTPQVGATLTANTGNIGDADGLGTFSYQWMRTTNPTVDIPGATGRTYTLTAADAGATISVRVSFMDDERYPESRASSSTSVVVGALGRISKIEPGITGVVVSGGEDVTLTVEVYGMQGDMDQSLADKLTLMWSVNPSGGSLPADAVGNYMTTYTAPSSPGTYVVTAKVGDGDCKPSDKEMRDAACSASFEVRVRRPSAPQPEDEAPANPPGDIPTILTDGDGNQYEVFTPVEGGTFDPGEGYSITAAAGAVPNGEFIGVRMSDDGAASNLGMTHQRYTLGGNMYGVHVVDSAGATVSDYVLDDAAKVCVPLPSMFRARISDLALVTINSDGSLTILAANVRLGDGGSASVCGNLSNLPASVAVGSMGAPDAIPTATPIPTPVAPETGGSAPSSNGMLWVLVLGSAIVLLGGIVAISARRSRKGS